MTHEPFPVFDPTVPPPGLKPRPKNVDISITGRCNLTCQYCFYADEMAALSDLPAERWLAFSSARRSLSSWAADGR